MNEEIKLRVNGVDFGGWKEVEIVAGLERQARDFTFGVTQRWPGATDIPRRIKQGDLCEVLLGKDKLLTGYVDATPISYSGKSITVGVKGRSKTADLVDCSAVYKTGQWTKAKIEQIATDLVKPFKDMKVIVNAPTGDAMINFRLNPGETAFEAIDRMLTQRQMLATDDADGNVVFVKIGAGGRAVTMLEYGKNILTADAALDYKDVFSSYVVKGQASAYDENDAETSSSASSSITYAGVLRYRALVIVQSGQVTIQACSDRARFERAHRAAKALETTYTVNGWRQADGAIWLPNQLVRVIDPVIGYDGEMLIVEVALRKNDSGMTTTMKVGPKAGYVLDAKNEKGQKDPWPDARSAK